MDQLLLSRAILESGLCGLPRWHRLWRMVGLNPRDTPANGDGKCFKGCDWEHCASPVRRRLGTARERCLWHHFPRRVRPGALLARYRSILSRANKAAGRKP